ncbi:MAG: recombinase family protein, partial [Acidobacteria bacterium]|nr:recombinase family protein [Acidobacteriota bacterium]
MRRTPSNVRSNEAVAYARVSTKDQEREGFSIPAQLRLINEYAAVHGLKITETYTEAETAGHTGREAFGRMMNALKSPGTCRTILVEKTDRLYRNARDMVDLNDLKVEIHFIKEGRAVSEDSKPSDKLVNTILTATAQHFLDNLREETRKGMLEKARSGLWPSSAPLGYLNTPGPNGKKIIVPDPEMATHVQRMFERYSTGRFSLRQVAQLAVDEGMRFRRSTGPMPAETVRKMLKNPIFNGRFVWDGVEYEGSHEPLVSVETFDRVQEVLQCKRAVPLRITEIMLAYKGLMTCRHCGCAIVGQIQKKRYTYYRCSGYKGSCHEPYAREEVLDQSFSEQLDLLSIDDEVMGLIEDGIRKLSEEGETDRVGAMNEANQILRALKGRQELLYEDRLEGRIDTATYDRKAVELRRKTRSAEERLAALKNPSRTRGTERPHSGTLELARTASREYSRRSGPEKREMLDYLVSNCSWGDGRLDVEFKHPYALLAVANAEYRQKKAAGEPSDGLCQLWYPRRDS